VDVPLVPRPAVQSIGCLNHMVADAMTHVPSCLRYLAKLNDPSVFRFCAIPQVMAIATLEELVSNPKVFTGVVKIRKGMAVKVGCGRVRWACVCVLVRWACVCGEGGGGAGPAVNLVGVQRV
jgi:phytoene/squalene synthetase